MVKITIPHGILRHLAAPLVLACAAHGGCTAIGPEGLAVTDSAEQVTGVDAGRRPESDDALSFARSGDRLQALYFTAGGVDQFRSFRDKVLGSDCAWAPSQTGVMRCFPLDTVEVRYLDADCTQAVASREDDFVFDQWQRPLGDRVAARRGLEGALVSGEAALEGTDFWCWDGLLPRRRAVYRVGPEVLAQEHSSSPQAATFALRDGQCQLMGPLSRAQHLEPVDETVLEEGSVSIIEVGGGFGVRRLVGLDGSALTLGPATEGEPCTLVSGLCVPGRLTSVFPAPPEGSAIFSDAQCSEVAFPGFYPADICPGPAHGVLGLEELGLGDPLQVFELRPTRSRFVSGQADDGTPTCKRIAGLGVSYEKVREVTSILPRAIRRTIGHDPIYRQVFIAPSPDRFIPLEQGSGFFTAKAWCDVVAAEDGSFRCFPSDMRYRGSDYWRDPDCTDGLLTASSANFDPAESVIPDQAPNVVSLLKRLSRAEVYEGPTYAMRDGACVSERRTSELKLLTRGSDLPFSRLLRVDLVAR